MLNSNLVSGREAHAKKISDCISSLCSMHVNTLVGTIKTSYPGGVRSPLYLRDWAIGDLPILPAQKSLIRRLIALSNHFYKNVRLSVCNHKEH